MNQEKRNKIMDTMVKISKQVDAHLDEKTQKRENMSYYNDFEFKGSGLGAENVYIVEISNKKQKKTGDKSENIGNSYEIYSEKGQLIATVTEKGKLHFEKEYIEQLRNIDENYLEQLNLDDLDFELPEELEKDDITMTKDELEKHSEGKLDREKDGTKKDEKEEEKEVEQETEEEKKEKTAEALGIDESEIKSLCTINPQEKVTDKHNLVDIMPEASGYKEISIVYGGVNDKSHGQFTILGVTQDGTREQINSIEPVEGTSTSKNVISINEDGSEVTEKQVKGLFRINSRSRNDGISVSIGDYGMMNVDYVSNVMDKENRRTIPIRTKDSQNQRIPTYKVRENAGDSIEEMKKEGKIFRDEKEDGVDPQSLDGIDIDEADGKSMTLEELKQYIKEEALEKGDMSRGEMDEFIKSEIAESGLELTESEIEEATEDIKEDIVDESRFPTRGDRR